MDKILMKGMRFLGYHGVLPKEARDGQPFEVDVEICLDLQKPGHSDEIKDTVDYSEIYALVKEKVENQRVMLLETLAEILSKSILDGFKRVEKIRIQIRKPKAPIDGDFDWVGVEIERYRHGS